jgi:F-type H+-transporting ATPase subunit c
MDAISSAKAAAYIGAAFVMGIGTIGPALAQGIVGAKACETLGKYPESADKVRLSLFVILGLIESSAIYAFLIALMLLIFGS